MSTIISIISMVTVVFGDLPKKRRGKTWQVHTGDPAQPFMDFPTKRLAAEFAAEMGRCCTNALRELNEIYRRACADGQGFVPAMATGLILQWNKLKADFDGCLAYLSMRKSAEPPFVYARLEVMAAIISQMGALIGSMVKARYTGTETAMASCTRQATELAARLRASRTTSLDAVAERRATA